MFDGIIPTTARGFANLTLFASIACSVICFALAFFSSAYRIKRTVTGMGAVEYVIWGRYPNSLIWYGAYPTMEAAEKKVRLLDRLYAGEDIAQGSQGE